MHKLVILFGILIISTTVPNWAQSIYQPGTNVADFIKDATARIHQSIDYSGIAPKMATLQAANQLSAIIGNLQVAFSGEMLQPISLLEDEDRLYFKKVAELIAQLERGTQLLQLKQSALIQNEQLRDRQLPLFLNNINTAFLTTHQKRSRVELIGDFPNDYAQTYQPMAAFSHIEQYPELTQQEKDNGYLILNETTTIKIGAIPNRSPVTFEMPISKYLPQPTQNISIQKITFSLPYLDISQQVLTATYNFWLGTPPTSPGSIILKQKHSKTQESTPTKKTRTYTQHATMRDIIETYCVPSTDQASLISSSVELVIEHSKGTQDQDWSYYRQQSDQNICFVVETFNQVEGPGGQLDFHLTYQIKSTEQQQTTSKESLVLKWDDTQTIPLNSGDWHLIFTDYLGRRDSFSQPTQKSLIRITVKDNKLMITTPPVTQHWRL